MRKLFGKELLNFFRLLLRGKIFVFEKIGQCDRTERKRDIVEHISAVVINDLRAAAADLRGEREFVLRIGHCDALCEPNVRIAVALSAVGPPGNNSHICAVALR